MALSDGLAALGNGAEFAGNLKPSTLALGCRAACFHTAIRFHVRLRGIHRNVFRLPEAIFYSSIGQPWMVSRILVGLAEYGSRFLVAWHQYLTAMLTKSITFNTMELLHCNITETRSGFSDGRLMPSVTVFRAAAAFRMIFRGLRGPKFMPLWPMPAATRPSEF